VPKIIGKQAYVAIGDWRVGLQHSRIDIDIVVEPTD